MQDGLEVNVDEAYIRESILDPQAKIVRGFQPVMPTFQGQLQDPIKSTRSSRTSGRFTK